MEVILDSSFIISCVRKRIDFLDQLQAQGYTIKVPREVLQEMKDLKKKNKTSQDDRIAIDVALQLIENRKIKKMTFGSGKIDDYLIQYGQKGAHIATLDRGIKNRIKNKIVIFSSKGTVGEE